MTLHPAADAAAPPAVDPGAGRRSLYRLFAFACAIMLIANAASLFLAPLAIDGEAYAFNPNPDDFVGSGRWSAYLLARYLLPYPSIPVVPILIACLSLSAAYVVTARSWDARIGWPHYLAAPLALCHPILFQCLSFNVISYAVGLGILSCALGLHALDRPTPLRFAASVALFAFGFGVYQAVALFPCAAFMVGAGAGLARRGVKRTLLRVLVFGTSVVLAVLLDRAINGVFYARFHVTTFYVDSYLDLGHLRDHFLPTLRDTLRLATPVLFGVRGPFISRCGVYEVAIACCGASALAYCVRTGRTPLRVALSAGLVFGAVLFSILPPLVSQGSLPWRVYLGTPIALAGVVFCAGRVGGRPVRAALGALVAMSFLAFAQIGARLYYSQTMVWLNDRALGEAILERIDALGGLPAHGPIRVEFAGHHDWPKSDQIIDVGGDSVMGRSFFEQDDGNPGRMRLFLRTLGRFDLELVSPRERAAILPEVEAMPAWPRRGSVRMVDGIAVVRFGPYSEVQKDELFPKAGGL